MRKIAAITVLAAIIVCPLYSNNLTFMSGISIKNASVSGSYAPFTSDAFSPYINPAGLANTPRQEFRLMHYNLFSDSSLSALAYAFPVVDRGTFSVSGIFLNIPDIEGRDIYNQPTETFSESFKVIGAGYGISAGNFIDLGINAKYINHNFYGINKTAYGLDAGMMLRFPGKISVSCFTENIVKPEFKFNSNSDILPLKAGAAAGFELNFSKELRDSLKTAAGAELEEFKKAILFHGGLEYSILSLYSLRCGISSEGWSAGAGAVYSGIELNYALIKMPLDIMHRFSVSYSFGDNIRALEERLKNKEERLKYEMVKKLKNKAVIDFKSEIESFMSKGMYTKAQEVLAKALVWAPENSWFIEKEKILKNLANKEKKEALIKEARKLLSEDQYIDAMVDLRTVLEMDPGNRAAAAMFKRAKEFVQTLGEKNFAVEEKNRKQIKAHFNRGLDLYAKKDYSNALKEWDKVIKSSPLQKQVYSYIQKAQRQVQKQKDQKKTVKLLKEQKKQKLYNKAVLSYTRGKFEESIELWRQLLEQDPDNTEAKEYLEKITREYREMQKQNLGW